MLPDREPRGDRRYLAAIGLFVLGVSTGLFLGLYPEKPHISGNAGYEEQDARYYPGGSECRPSVVGALTWRERLEARERCREAEEQHRLSTNDLIQQRRSADAADAMAVTAYQQAWVSVFGLIFGFLTLVAAGLAALYAGMAALAAKDAARAGWRAVELTREHGEESLCAYCIVERAELKTYAHDLVAEITIRNVGDTVARAVSIKGLFESRKVSTNGEEFSIDVNFLFGTIYPAETATEWANINDVSIPHQFRPRLISGDHEARYIIFSLAWMDIFDRLHQAGYTVATRDATRETFIQTHTLKGTEPLISIYRSSYTVTPKDDLGKPEREKR